MDDARRAKIVADGARAFPAQEIEGENALVAIPPANRHAALLPTDGDLDRGHGLAWGHLFRFLVFRALERRDNASYRANRAQASPRHGVLP